MPWNPAGSGPPECPLLPRVPSEVPSSCHPDTYSCVPMRCCRSPSVATKRGEVGELPEETRKVLSAPRVIRTPDLLIRRRVRSRYHLVSIRHSSSRNRTSERRNCAYPRAMDGRARDASAPHVTGQFATALQPGRGVFGTARPRGSGVFALHVTGAVRCGGTRVFTATSHPDGVSL